MSGAAPASMAAAPPAPGETRRVRRRLSLWVGGALAWIALMVLVALLADVLRPYSITALDLSARLQPPLAARRPSRASARHRRAGARRALAPDRLDPHQPADRVRRHRLRHADRHQPRPALGASRRHGGSGRAHAGGHAGGDAVPHPGARRARLLRQHAAAADLPARAARVGAPRPALARARARRGRRRATSSRCASSASRRGRSISATSCRTSRRRSSSPRPSPSPTSSCWRAVSPSSALGCSRR